MARRLGKRQAEALLAAAERSVPAARSAVTEAVAHVHGGPVATVLYGMRRASDADRWNAGDIDVLWVLVAELNECRALEPPLG